MLISMEHADTQAQQLPPMIHLKLRLILITSCTVQTSIALNNAHSRAQIDARRSQPHSRLCYRPIIHLSKCRGTTSYDFGLVRTGNIRSSLPWKGRHLTLTVQMAQLGNKFFFEVSAYYRVFMHTPIITAGRTTTGRMSDIATAIWKVF